MEFTEREQKAPRRSLGSALRVGFVALVSVIGAGLGASACLDRPLCDVDCRPRTTNIFVETLQQKTVDKIDLLFMIDNSISMADKQAILKEAVPDLVQRLVSPNCVSADGTRGTTPPDPDAPCGTGFDREFTPIKNIHIGVITSSLGGHGADKCGGHEPKLTALENEESNDSAHLIATRPRFAAEAAKYPGVALQPPDPAGFLNWNPPSQPDKKQDITAFSNTFKEMVTASSEFGCGYEAQLEAVYRFLSDPVPYKTITSGQCPGSTDPKVLCAFAAGTDEDLLNQRKVFLRPDSLVAVIMVTDENDCSIQDSSQGFYAARADIPLPRATRECINPNDRCCRTCRTNPPPDGCQADPTCTPDNLDLSLTADQLNLRCFQQKQRFGLDFLYPTERYVNAMSQSQLCTSADNGTLRMPANPQDCPDANKDGKADVYPNPLFSDLAGSGKLPREKTLVFFAGIVGVPYQDIQATADPDGKAYPADELHFKVAKQLVTDGVWDKILGTPYPGNNLPPVPPTDNLMLESTQQRGGNDGTGQPLAPPNSPSLANKINSHEWANPVGDDLMFACVFPLATPRNCDDFTTVVPKPGCDCERSGTAPGVVDPTAFNPLCQDPASNAYSTTQHFAKAYPGLRELQVLKDYGANSIVASICAQNPDDSTKKNYGYRPAVDAIVDRLKEALTGKCLPRVLKKDATSGKIPCSVIEVRPAGAVCDPNQNRAPASQDVIEPARQRLKDGKKCDGVGQPACNQFVFCEIKEAGDDCHTTGAQKEAGWCYVDPSQNATKGPGEPQDDPALVKACAPNEKRILRFVDPNPGQTPSPDATVLIACFGADLDNDNATPTVTAAPTDTAPPADTAAP
jgi:hypothetical protein